MILFKCQSCDQEMSVPDSQVGQFEACPACKAIVVVPDPSQVLPQSEPPESKNALPSAAGMAKAAKWLEQSAANVRCSRAGVEAILEVVGVLIAALGACSITMGVALLLITGEEKAVQAYAAIGSGIMSFPAGLALATLGSAVVELKQIRRLLEEKP